MLQAINLDIQGKRKTANINVKTTFIKTVIGEVVAHLKPQKITIFFKFEMYCIINTCSVECYGHYSDDTTHF